VAQPRGGIKAKPPPPNVYKCITLHIKVLGIAQQDTVQLQAVLSSVVPIQSLPKFPKQCPTPVPVRIPKQNARPEHPDHLH